MATQNQNSYLQSRRSILKPTKHHFVAIELLTRAAQSHRSGNASECERLLVQADIDELHEQFQLLMGPWHSIHRLTKLPGRDDIKKSLKSSNMLDRQREFSTEQRKVIYERDGFHCRFCEVPVIPNFVWTRIRKLYPSFRWNRAKDGWSGQASNSKHHFAYQALMLGNPDHVLPHCFGGRSSLENGVTACSPCNSARNGFLLEELSLLDPRIFPPKHNEWDGLSNEFRV